MIGLVEVLAAFGLILPMALDTMPLLTPLAAAGVILTMLGAPGPSHPPQGPCTLPGDQCRDHARGCLHPLRPVRPAGSLMKNA